MSDPRKLPTKEVADVAKRIYDAASLEDNDALQDACGEWLVLKGYDKNCPVRFDFRVKKKLLDFHVHVTARFQCDDSVDKDSEATRSSGYAYWPKDKSEQESSRVAAGFLLGVELAIEASLRVAVNKLVFDKEVGDLKLYEALRTAASVSI